LNNKSSKTERERSYKEKDDLQRAKIGFEVVFLVSIVRFKNSFYLEVF